MARIEVDDVWYRCAVCGAVMTESELLQDDEGDPVACRFCGSSWVDEFDADDDGWPEPECDEE